MNLPTFTFSTTADEVATALASEAAGKNVLITGTSIGGIGFEAARVMAKYANLVIIAGYSSKRLKLSEEAIKKDVPSANIRCLSLDLSSLATVRRAASEVNAYPEPLHVLINNAAGGSTSFTLTADGLESKMATDHFGPFLLTKLLAPKLIAARTDSYVPRVVIVSSVVHVQSPGINFATLRHPESADALMGYREAKCANLMTAIELSRRAKGQIHAFSLHPGVIFTNVLKKEDVVPLMQNAGFLTADGKPNTDNWQWKTIPQGAATTIAAAFDPRLNDKSGAYLVDSNVANEAIAPHCSDRANCEKLWTVTEEILAESFTF